MNTNVTNKQDLREGMLKGIKVATDLIRTTYGPEGYNVSVESDLYPFVEVANDAQTIIQAIKIEEKTPRRGLNFLKELMDKINTLSADGRKTTAILLEEIFERGINSGLSGGELKTQLDDLIPIIEENISNQTIQITEEDVHKVATIASESKELGNIIGEIYKYIGKGGIIIPESSGTYETSYSFIEGVRFNAGYLSPYMAHDVEAVKDGQKETKAIYENPVILVTKKKIEKDYDIEPLVTNAMQTNRPLVIFTDDMDSGVASRMIATHKVKASKLLIIKAPVLWKNYVFEDFAKVVGATIVEDASGVNFKNLELSHLGTCGKITVDKDETTIVGIQDITEHLNELKKEGSDDSKLRLSWLATKTAILRLGANSESELSHKRLKCYDAINSSRLALKDGVVAGGGFALSNSSKDLPNTVEGNILKEALSAPMKQNMENMGIKNWDGYYFGEDVLDASIVIKNAVRNAIALASTMLTLGGDVSIPPKTAEEIALLSKQQMRF